MINIQTVYRGQCSLCDEIKTSTNHMKITVWAEHHKCASNVVYSNVFDQKENDETS